jgi:hypothetical protein
MPRNTIAFSALFASVSPSYPPACKRDGEDNERRLDAGKVVEQVVSRTRRHSVKQAAKGTQGGGWKHGVPPLAFRAELGNEPTSAGDTKDARRDRRHPVEPEVSLDEMVEMGELPGGDV